MQRWTEWSAKKRRLMAGESLSMPLLPASLPAYMLQTWEKANAYEEKGQRCCDLGQESRYAGWENIEDISSSGHSSGTKASKRLPSQPPSSHKSSREQSLSPEHPSNTGGALTPIAVSVVLLFRHMQP